MFHVPHRSTELIRRLLKKDGEGDLDGPFRSQSAHDQKVLPRCARLGPIQATLLKASKTAAALLGGFFEQPARSFSCCATRMDR